MIRLASPAQTLKLPNPPESTSRADIGVEALRRLRLRGYMALRDVSCEVHGGDVRLLGRLPSYYLKQLAQTAVAEVEGVRQVVNLIEVAAPASRPSSRRNLGSRSDESIGSHYASHFVGGAVSLRAPRRESI